MPEASSSNNLDPELLPYLAWAKREQRKNKIKIVETVILIVATVICLGLLAHGAWKCNAVGGSYIRTLFWYTCIDKK